MHEAIATTPQFEELLTFVKRQGFRKGKPAFGVINIETGINGAQSALWAEINRQLTKIRVWRILRAVRFERFDQSTTSNNVTDWLIFLLMLAWTVTFADVGARNRQARVQNYGHCWAYNFRTFPCKYWFVTTMKNRTSCDNYNQNWILYSENV